MGEILNNDSPQSLHVRFRNEVAGFLSGVLRKDVRSRNRNERGQHGSHIALPGTSVRITAGRGRHVGVALEEARQAAEVEGLPLSVVIAHRERQPVSEALAVMRLVDYSHLLSVATSKGLASND
jgi:hypothetical protein